MPDPAPPAAAPDRDPVTGLRPMSRTAGLGMHDYAAINTFAVVALALGLAGWLVVFGAALVVVPLAGLILAVLAVRQIRRSSGTETGLLLAILGGLLSLGFIAYAVATYASAATRDRTDTRQIDAAVKQLGRDIVAAKFDAAYALFHPRFHEAFPRQAFEQDLRGLQSSPFYGKVDSLRAGDILRFETDRSTGRRTGVGQIVATITLPDGKTAEPRHNAVFWKDGDTWKVLSLSDWFATPEQKAARAAPPGGP